MRTIGALAILTLAACGGGSNFTDAAPSPDARRAADATPAPDARPIDATPPDAAPPDAMTGTVTLRAANSGGAPEAGKPVVFLDAADNVISDTTTDSNGDASAVMAAGGSVVLLTVAPPLGGTQLATVYAWTDVQPGETVTVGRPEATSLTVDITVASEANATSYTATSPCGSASSGTTTITTPVCNGANDLYVEADGSSGYLGAFLSQNDTITTTTPIDFTGDSWAGLLSVTATRTNAPVDEISSSVYASLRGGAIPNGIGSLQSITPGTPYSVPDIGGTLVYDVFYLRSGQQYHDYFITAPESGTVTLDTSNPIGDAPTASYDIPSGTVSFTPGAAIDHAVTHIHAVRPGSQYMDWYISRPGNSTSIHVPHLPASHDAANFVATDNPGATVRIFTTDSPATGDALKAHPFDVGFPLSWLAPGSWIQASN